MLVVDPGPIADKYLNEIETSVRAISKQLNIVGFIATADKPSLVYANSTRATFTRVGFNYELRQVTRLDLEAAVLEANEDVNVHGIFIYFPVFKNQQDDYLRNLVDFTKDIEAGSVYWTRKLYSNDRLAISGDNQKKALIPCTPLAIVKILTGLSEYGEGEKPVSGKIITIFNRSEVIGRPLAVMMSNDGATVYSFDENGPLKFEAARPHETGITRAEALAISDIVITGVPDPGFEKVRVNEINTDAVCVNFSSLPNFDDDVARRTRVFVPRVGPMTVAMCMRNMIRLYENFHT